MRKKMNPILAILLTIANEKEGRLQGRTLLQKKLYFLSMLMNTRFDFRPHYYGPYSDITAEALNDLVTSGFVKETSESFASNSVFGETVRYSYSLTDDGKSLFDSVQNLSEFKKWGKTLRKINGLDMASDFNLLSIAAKIHFIVSEHKEVSRGEIRQVGNKLGWKIHDKDIDKVIKDLEALGLVAEQVH